MIESVVRWIMEEPIYSFIVWLKVKRNYVIPVDTSKENIVRQNILINIIGLAADWICAIVIFIGWSQHVLTYVGMMTIAMYIFVDHFKIYVEQYKKLKKKTYICKIRQKQYKYLKWYTPNLLNIIFSGVFFILLLFMAVVEQMSFYIVNSEWWYRFLTLLILVYMMYIKTKQYFLDTFDIKECIFVKKEK